MLLGGRSTHTLTHVLRLPRTIFPHHVTPVRTRFTTDSKQHASLEPNDLAHNTNSREHSDLIQENLAGPAYARLVDFLNTAPPKLNRVGRNATHARHTSSLIGRDVVSAYLSVREYPSGAQQLRAPAYLRIAWHAGKQRLQQILDILAEDLLTHYPRDTDPEGFSDAIVVILSHATSRCPLSHKRILELYEALTVSKMVTPPSLSPELLHRIFVAILASPDAYMPPLESLAPALLSSDAHSDTPNGSSTWITYKLLVEILMEGKESYPQALMLFQRLIQSGRIPTHIQELAKGQGGSFKTIIVSTLVRGCLATRWVERAAKLLLEILREPGWPHAEGMTEEDVRTMADLGVEILQALEHFPTKSDLRTSQKLIQALLSSSQSRPPPMDLPHAIIFSYYTACYNLRLTDSAASLYCFLQSPRIRDYHQYPPPRQAALLWLFEYFASPSVTLEVSGQRPNLRGRMHIARSLAKDVLDRRYPIPLMDRPRFIALAAARGLGLYARKLWELYTAEDDPERDVVRGNAQMLVRVVSLFRKLQERWDAAVAEERPDRTFENNQLKYKVIGSPNTAIVRQDSPDVADVKELLPRDYWQFAERVLKSYIETKQPLAMASQQDLSALARARLLLGHIPEGLETLTIVIDRGYIPDQTDINISLTAMAGYSPRRAARMIETMIQRGVQPDAVTFSAVIHAALRDKDKGLVELLVARARALGHGALTQKAIASLLRASISFELTTDLEERLRQRRAVKRAMQIIQTVIENPTSQAGRKDHGKDHVLSVNMGKDCVKAALKVVLPEMAFRFWRLLVKNRVLWADKEHKDTRGWIARSLRDQWRRRHLDHDRANEMLHELGETEVDADGPR